MVNDYSIKPKIADYSCLVDLLGRAGRLHEAYAILKRTASIREDVKLLSKLFSACHIHGDLELGEKIVKWDEARKVRLKMKELGLRKNPSCTLIEICKMIVPFLVEDKSIPQAGFMYQCFSVLAGHMNKDELLFEKIISNITTSFGPSALGDHNKLGDLILGVLQECIQSHGTGRNSVSNRTKEHVNEILHSRERLKLEKKYAKKDLNIKQAAAVKLEGKSLFSSKNISEATSKYSEALALCPVRSKKERVILYSNRAKCYLLLQQPLGDISDATHAFCLHNPFNRHVFCLHNPFSDAHAFGITTRKFSSM
ncbi:pentatricopeptide repeat-containing protein [Tanacetum coccineum]